MQTEAPVGGITGAVVHLNRDSLESAAVNLLGDVLIDKSVGDVALVSSFGAESAVLLHLVSRVDPATPVIMLDTGMLFEETLDYQAELVADFGLTGFRRVSPDPADLAAQDPQETLHRNDTDACCHWRKTVPLQTALRGFSGWITGRKRFQANSRANIRVFEADSENAMIKINPLAFWEPYDLKAYFEKHDLPRHPLVAQGYPSIGCRPCTSPVQEGEDSRSGRWRGEAKEECGIHIVDGQVIRQSA